MIKTNFINELLPSGMRSIIPDEAELRQINEEQIGLFSNETITVNSGEKRRRIGKHRYTKNIAR